MGYNFAVEWLDIFRSNEIPNDNDKDKDRYRLFWKKLKFWWIDKNSGNRQVLRNNFLWGVFRGSRIFEKKLGRPPKL